MAKGFFLVTDNGTLRADDDRAQRLISTLGHGTMVELDIKTRGRDTKTLRFYWKMCSLLADSTPGLSTARQVDHILKVECGACTVVKRSNGDFWKIPDSIAFDEMEEPPFRAYLDRCSQFIRETWLPHLTHDQLWNEVSLMVGGR